MKCALVHGLHRRLDRAEGGDEDDRHLGPLLPDLREEVHPGHAGHRQVRQHEVIGLALQRFQGLPAGGRRSDAVPFLLKQPGQQLADPLLVVHHQNPGVGRHSPPSSSIAGSSMVKAAPSPKRLSTESFP